LKALTPAAEAGRAIKKAARAASTSRTSYQKNRSSY